jgi:hypothetical protein
MPDMLPGMDGFNPSSGKWQARAESIVAELLEAGYLTEVTAGYGDSLIQAGTDRDLAELRGSLGERFRSGAAWDRALSRIIPPPSDGGSASNDRDPWEQLSEGLRSAAAMGNAPDA